MADIAVTVSMGAMKPVLKKLTTLMGDKYKKVKGLREEVEFLNRELGDMNALLEKMDEADELDPQAKNWRKDIIDMSYDIEDYIDDFTGRVGEAGDDVGVLRKASHYLRTFKDRCRIASQIKKIKAKVIEAGERRKRYMLDQCIPSTSRVIVDPRLPALYQKSESLVGIDSQKEEIVRWVMDEGQRQLKVMSIVGFGGLGKTTLANEVYREVGEKFDCKAFISISQNPDIIKLLNRLMKQLGLQPYSHACEPEDLINSIIEHLQNKRYLIIVDDLWDDRQAWRTINCSFPTNNLRSRVMITTRNEKVARECCGNDGFIHNMEPLSEKDSRKLFFHRIFGSEDACPPDFIEASRKVLKKCGGLPLAIITMASMIACQPTISKGHWAEYIDNSLAAEFATNPTYEDMMRIIDFSYKNLPCHLKACFLYLGSYPEDHRIERVELVRRWVAEGFVSCSGGQDVWDVAESYFSELVNRSMIQPAYEDCDDFGIKITQCRVHDMMLELILRKCEGDNFISLIHDPEMVLGGQDKVIRRLSINLLRGADGGITVMANTRHLSQVRSLNIFRGICRIPNLAEFKFLRVLFLDVGFFARAVDLTGINHLSLLKYLKVVGGSGSKVLLPAQIGGVPLLETLDLFELSGDYSCLPQEIVDDVPRLSHVSGRGRLPNRIGMAKSLITLRGFNLAMSSLESITGLGELTALSTLILTCGFKIQSGDMMALSTLQIAALITSLEKLGNLRTIQLWCDDTVYHGDAMLGPSFHKIEWLELNLLMFSVVPRWIGHLHYLRVLRLRAKQIHQEDFNVIGTKLTSLRWLFLHISRIPTERIVIGGSTGFKVLKRFWFDGDGVSCLTFEAGAMPDLNLLFVQIDPVEWDKATPVGLQQLPSLKRIQVFAAASREEEELIRGVFQEAVDALPTRPTLDVGAWRRRPKEMMMT